MIDDAANLTESARESDAHTDGRMVDREKGGMEWSGLPILRSDAYRDLFFQGASGACKSGTPFDGLKQSD